MVGDDAVFLTQQAPEENRYDWDGYFIDPEIYQPDTNYEVYLEEGSVSELGLWMFYNTDIKSLSYITDKLTRTDMMFSNCSDLTSVSGLSGKLSSVVDASNMFFSCTKLTSVPVLDLTSCENFGAMFSGCSKLHTIEGVYMDGTDYDYNSSGAVMMFLSCRSLENVGFLRGLEISVSFEYSPLLTRESVLNIFNSINTIYNEDKTPTITFNSALQEKLSSDDIVIAINKGWNVEFI